MKVIIAGSRKVEDYAAVERAIAQSGFPITEVVLAGARGVEAMGEIWAVRYGVPVKRFPTDWTLYGRSAGLLRDREMALYADALIAVHDGRSRGIGHMIEAARTLGLTVSVWQT